MAEAGLAQLGIAGGGAAISAALGVGPAPGWVIGSIIGAALFGGQDDGNGLRIGDRTITSSAYGTAIPEAYGVVRLAGNVIWAKDIEIREGSSGGKSISESANGTSQIAVASFAVAFAKGPATFLSKMWADGNLIYDFNDSQVGQSLLFRIYLGTETQAPDPGIQDDKGVSAVPAHLGLVYVVFEDLPLGPYGNRAPSISAEIAYDGIAVTLEDTLSLTGGNIIDGNFIAQRFDLDFFTVLDTFSGSGTVVIRCTVSPPSGPEEISHVSMQEEFSGPMITNPDHPVQYFVDWIPLGGPFTQLPILRGREDTSQKIEFGVADTGIINEIDKFTDTTSGAVITTDNGLNSIRQYLVTNGVGGQIGVIESTENSLDFIFLLDLGRECLVVSGGEENLRAFAWLLTEDLELFQLSVARTSASVPVVEVISIHNFADIGTTRSGLWFDQTDGGIIAAADTGVLAKWDPLTGDRQWTSEVIFPGSTLHPSASTSLIQNRRLSFIDDQIYSMDSLTGELVSVSPLPRPYSHSNFQCFWGYADCHIVFAEGEVRRWCLNRLLVAQDTVPVSLILEELAGLAGISLVDATLVSSSVTGYAITRAVTAREAMQALTDLFSIESVARLDTLIFLDKDKGDFIGTVLEEQVIDEGETIRESRVDLNEIPNQVDLSYIDPDRDFQKNIQRLRLPEELVSNQGDSSKLEFPITITANIARRAAEVILLSSLDERVSVSFTLSREFLRLEPTDRLTLETLDNRTLELRVVQTTIDPETFSMDVDAVGTDVTIFDPSDIPGDPGDSATPIPPVNPSTFLVLPDLPLLLDIQDTNRVFSLAYFGLSGFGQLWLYGSLFRSQDSGLSWANLGFSDNELVRGYTIGALAGTDHPFATDKEGVFDIQLITGEPGLISQITELQLLNGANIALVGSEVIQFRDVVTQPDGTIRLSYLLRGRRGTELSTESHINGEVFVLLNQNQLKTFSNELSNLGNLSKYRAVGQGQSIPQGIEQTLSLKGADLLPYEPANLSIINDIIPSQTWKVTWFRRTRVGGEWLDFVDVPLSEDTELYDIEIHETGGPLVRTITGLTTSSFDYPLVTAQNDFGVIPATWDFTVYQVSGQVGRGRSTRRTFDTG